MAQSEIKLKLLVDSKARKVLFAEADKKFIDFLFTLLSLPLGAVIRVLKKESMVGCLSNLYESVESLNETYMQQNKSKESVLNPKVVSSSCLPMLLPYIDFSTSPTLFYMCRTRSYTNCYNYIAYDSKAICPQCKNYMSYLGTFVEPATGSKMATTGADQGGFVKGVVTYMVMDDLSVKPILSTISSITLLNKFKIKDVEALEEKSITLDVYHAVKLLETSLQSKTVLTDVFLLKVLETEGDQDADDDGDDDDDDDYNDEEDEDIDEDDEVEKVESLNFMETEGDQDVDAGDDDDNDDDDFNDEEDEDIDEDDEVEKLEVGKDGQHIFLL